MIALALLAVLAADPGDANDRARKLLADERYGFCHDREFPLTRFEAAWCPPLAPDPNPRCPRFHDACKAPRAELDHLGRLDFQRGEPRRLVDPDEDAGDDPLGPDADDPAAKPAPGERKTPDRKVVKQAEFRMPDLGGVGFVLFWIVLGAGLALIVWLIWRNSSRDRLAGDEAPTEAPPALGPLPPQGPSEQLVRDVAALLDQARAAASAGDYAKAVQRAHAALLHRLDHDGLIRVAPSRTNGDYVQDLRPQPALRGTVKDIVRDVERVQFGTAPADAGAFDRVFQRVVPIATRRGDALALLLVAGGLMSCELAKTYPFDHSPSGAQAVIDLAAQYDRAVDFRTVRLSELDPEEDGPTLVLLHDAPLDARTWTRLLRWAEQGHTLVAAGVVPAPEFGLSLTTGASGHVLEVSDAFAARWGALDLVTADDAYFAGDLGTGEPALAFADGKPYAVRYERGFRGGAVWLLADDRLLTNGGLMLADNPEFVARFLRDVSTDRVELADGLLDDGADNPADTLARSHLTPAILQLLALLAALYLCRGVRFGRPTDPPARSRRQFREHVEALGLQFARGRASRHALRLYAAWALERLRDRTLGSRQPGLYALAQAVAARTGDDEARVMQVLVEASGVRDDAELSRAALKTRPPAAAEDLRLMQELARLVRLVGGPR